MFLAWFDDNPRTPIPARIAAAIEAYRARFGFAPTVALVNAAELPDTPTIAGVAVRAAAYVRKDNYWIGCE